MSQPNHRTRDVERFYELPDELERRTGGVRHLAQCHGRLNWPMRGVYFFFEPSELRSGSGNGPRVVRIGTHALSATSRTTLWARLANHRGQSSGGGNHRGSIFRLLVGNALIAQDDASEPASWGIGSDPGAAAIRFGVDRQAIIAGEAELESAVSRYIGAMPFLWLAIDDPPGPESLRGYVERNSIALLSNAGGAAADPPSSGWLGAHCDRERVRRSGLWNQNHVDEAYEPAFLDVLGDLIARQVQERPS